MSTSPTTAHGGHLSAAKARSKGLSPKGLKADVDPAASREEGVATDVETPPLPPQPALPHSVPFAAAWRDAVSPKAL